MVAYPAARAAALAVCTFSPIGRISEHNRLEPGLGGRVCDLRDLCPRISPGFRGVLTVIFLSR